MIIHSPVISGSLTFAPGATFTLPPNGVYSGSFSGSVNGIGDPTTFSASLNTRIGQLSIDTGSQNSRLTNLELTSASILIETLNLELYTASNDTTNTTQNSRLNQLSTASGSAITRLTALEVETLNLELYTASNDTTNTTQNSRLNQLSTASGSAITRLNQFSTYTGSNDTTNTTQNSRLDQLSTASGSAITRLTALEVETLNLELYTASNDTTNATQNSRLNQLSTYTGSNDTTNTAQNSRLTNLELTSASVLIETLNLELYTASNDTKWSTLGSLSGSFARTNSTNTFTGNQTITGSLFVSQDLIVQGSSSIQNISSSNLNIGTNLITVATNNPSVRFGGFAVIDSGSAGGSGSFLYDSIQDEFIFIHRGNGTNITSSIFLQGPPTIDNLGNETYLSTNRIVKGGGLEHLADSNISDDGSNVGINSNTQITGSLRVSAGINGTINAFNGVVSGSSQIDVASTTGDIALGTRTSGNYVATITAGNGIVSSGATTGEGIAHTISAGGGVVSGSSQISHDSTTGYSANRHIDHTVVSITAGDGLTGGGDISTTRTLNVGGTTNRISVSADAVDIASTYVGQTSITTLGTIGTGVWQGSVIASAYLDADTAHLSDTQTFTGAKTFSSAVNITNNTASTTITTGALIVTGGVGISGALNVGGDVVAYASSDERLKNNVEVISNPIQKVQQLKGVTWEWNENADELQQSLPSVGVIAQDVEKVLPQLVHDRENGYKGVDYAKLTGLLIEAIKEQQKQIDELKSKLG